MAYKYEIQECKKLKGGYNLLIKGVVSGWYEDKSKAERELQKMVEDDRWNRIIDKMHQIEI